MGGIGKGVEGGWVPPSRLWSINMTNSDIRNLVLAAVGGALEFYGFVIFIFFTPIIAKLFFPPDLPEWVPGTDFRNLRSRLPGATARRNGVGAFRRYAWTKARIYLECPAYGYSHADHRIVADLRIRRKLRPFAAASDAPYTRRSFGRRDPGRFGICRGTRARKEAWPRNQPADQRVNCRPFLGFSDSDWAGLGIRSRANCSRRFANSFPSGRIPRIRFGPPPPSSRPTRAF